jgi:phosphatidylglycerol:prolipoprotein diacylglycerol transferase
MQQTLFTIPHSWFEGPLLAAWLIIGLCILGFLFWRHGNSSDTWSFLPIYVFVAIGIYFVFPELETDGINPADPTGPYVKQGLSIRGYGAFLLLAIASGMGITMLRCKRVGLTVDQLLALGFWMMVCGILGARLFYVIQKPEEYFYEGASFKDTIMNVINMTQGGLVVYGSLIGGTLAAIIYLTLNKLPILRTADLIAPGMVLGLAIGRIGCLMNGCCYGGVCAPELPSLRFPPGSAPYMQQLHRGELLGIRAELVATDPEASPPEYPWLVKSVEPGSIGEQLGLQPKDHIAIYMPDSQYIRFRKSSGQLVDGKELVGMIESKDMGTIQLPIEDLPDRSLTTHPTQVYSSINAALLCLTLWFFWTIRKSDGEVFGLMLILYSIGRFLIEIIRRDELGLLGTELTISQWVSLGVIVVGFVCFAFARTRVSTPEPQPATS